MIQQEPLYLKLYFDPCWTAVAQLIGYKGTVYRELWTVMKPVTEKYGQARTEQATAHLLTYEKQFTCNPPPLAKVELRSDIRTLAFQLLGPARDHPEYDRFQKPGCGIVASEEATDRPEPEKAKRRTRKKGS